MKNILLPTDFSENSRNAIRFALKFFQGETCTFFILNSQKTSSYLTADVLYGAQPLSVYEGVLSNNRKNLEELVHFCQSVSEGENFSFVPKLDFDNLIDAIKQAVTLNAIDGIVMGSNGATGAAEVVFGSNTLNVIHHVDCPLIVVPEGYVYQNIESVLFSIKPPLHFEMALLHSLGRILKKTKASLKILEIFEDETTTINDAVTELENEFEWAGVTRFTLKNIPAPIAINAFEQLFPVQLHAMVTTRPHFMNRFLQRSENKEISYKTPIPLFVLHS
jgi:nucleotide-binding universal stress UspA family protein